MSSLSCLELQQSARTNRVGRSAAGCWQLAPGRALSLRLQTPGALRVARGRAWLTLRGCWGDLPGAGADHVLHAGECLAIAAGQHVVMEAWSPPGCAEAVEVRWEGVTAPATLRAANADARDWEHGVAQPLRDLGRALGQLGRALGTAVAEVVHAGGRCAAGLARFALYRAMPRRQRVSCSARSESALP